MRYKAAMRHIVLAALLFAAPANAACRWTFVDGVQQQLCNDALDLPAIRPPAIAPIVPPSIRPIQPPVIPPIGTRSCRQAQVWNGAAYVWQNVCR
jgi:hypothetical protein